MAKGKLVTVGRATGRDDRERQRRRRRGELVTVGQATGRQSAHPTLDPLAAIRAAQARDQGGGDDGQGHGLFGHLGEVLSKFGEGAETAIHGFIPGIEMIGQSAWHDITHPHGLATGENPFTHIGESELYKNIVKPQAKALAYTYGPALPFTRGGLGETLHRAEDNPFGVALDLVTIATAGYGRAAAVMLTPTELGTGARIAAGISGKYGGPAREISVRGSEYGAEIPVRTLPRQGFRAGRMIATDKALKMLPEEFPVLGEFARAARQDLKDAIPNELKNQAHEAAGNYLKAFNRLTREERVASALVVRLPKEEDLGRWRAQLEYAADVGTGRAQKLATSTLKLINNPKVLEAYRYEGAGGERTRAAVEAGRELSTAREEILAKAGVNTSSFSDAVFRHMRVVRGAEVLSKGRAQQLMRDIDARLRDIGVEKKRIKSTAYNRTGVRAEARVGQKAEAEADRLSAYQDRRDEAGSIIEEVERLRKEYEDARVGNISTDQMAHYGVSPPRDYGTGTGNVGRAFEDAKHQAAVDAHRTEGDRLRAIYARLTRRGEVKVREADLNELLQEAGITIKAGTDMDKAIQRAAAAIERKLARHEKAAPKQAPVRPGMEGTRLQILGKISDELERLVSPRGHRATEERLQAEKEAFDAQPHTDAERKAFADEQQAAREGSGISPYERALVRDWQRAEARLKEIDARERAATSKTQLKALREERITLLQNLRERFSHLNEVQHELLDNRAHVENNVGSLFGGPTVEELRAEMEASGRPMPYYVPDKSAAAKDTHTPFARAGSGLTPSKADVRQSQHVLFNMGMLALDSNVLTPSFLRAVQHDYRVDLHERARRAASTIAEGEGLPAGYRWVREIRGQKIPYTETVAGEHMAGAARTFPEEYEKLTIADRNVDEVQIARDDEGLRLAVPEAYAKGLEGETRRAGLVNKLMVSRPLQVWRALVLHTNPNWLTNNVVGNAILATLRFSGIEGTKAFLGMIAETKGARGVRQLLNAPETRNHLTHEDILELFPAQRHGTAVETQFGNRQPLPNWFGGRLQRVERTHAFPQRVPGIGGRAISGRDVAAGSFRLLPTVDRATEGAFRRASLETMLRKSPEARAIYKAMPAETKSWRTAMREAAKDPKLARGVEREVNDALGSYLSLTAAERGVLRQVVPFYAWFREITRILLKTPFDAPLRANIAFRVSRVQQERLDEMTGDLPSYMRGIMPLGPPRNGEQRAVFLQGAGPFGTVPQLARAAQYGLFGGGPQYQQGLSSAAGMINPVLGAAIRQRDEGLVSGVWEGILQQLPLSRAAFGKTDSTLYPNRTRADMWMRYFGYPVRTYDVSAAHEYAKQHG